jgi:CRISPR/Cas system CSM-associated protein Csm3 (group 7 of RAMP superfamily)
MVMLLRGELYADAPIYRGNARKTLFTRDGDGTQRLVSLAGEVAGTAQTLMDAFIGVSKNQRNLGLLNRLWQRLYHEQMPNNLITRVNCRLQKQCYPRDNFFDLRMGIKLDEDRWAAESNANYKMETLFRNSIFDLEMHINDGVLNQGENKDKLYYVLDELKAGRFWFGAGKSKGLGRCRAEMKLPFTASKHPSRRNKNANHLCFTVNFNAENPVLIGWNWGKVDPNVPAFAAIEGVHLLEGMRLLPQPIKERLQMTIGGPILSPTSWKKNFATYLPRVIAIWLQEQSSGEKEFWVLPETAIKKLGKGKHQLSVKILENIKPIAEKPFANREDAVAAITDALAKANKANMAKRVLEFLEQQKQQTQAFDRAAWNEVAGALGFPPDLGEQVEAKIDDETALQNLLAAACEKILPTLDQQVDQQIRLLQSDAWIEMEIANREAHLKIKTMLKNGQITEREWRHRDMIPQGVKAAEWQEFLATHERVNYHHIMNRRNLDKSITNDENHIAFLKAYRQRTRQELSQPHHIDFRAGGIANREISRKYGKPYDSMFMRMLSWAPSAKEQGKWEIYIPGSTVKGAFRKRASQVLKTLLGETGKTQHLLNRVFGAQGQRGLVFFSDAYLKDPEDHKNNWCTMDGVKMDPKTAQPIEQAKSDYLFGYGSDLQFELRLDMQDIAESDLEAYSLLLLLLKDFRNGDIPLGGEKTNGFGWVKANLARVDWMAASANGIGTKLLGGVDLQEEGFWKSAHLAGEAATVVFDHAKVLFEESIAVSSEPPKAAQGFISHRAFGGYCGMLQIKGEVLTPLCVNESGEPTHRIVLNGEHINGWESYWISPPEADNKGEERKSALPSKSLRGMLRHVYAIASNSAEDSADLSHLNPADSLFGWVGTGQNNALAGRLSIHFAPFENAQLAWYKIPYPYGSWQFENGEWKNVTKGRTNLIQIADTWRIFPHASLAPCVEQMESFKPDIVQASYMRAILPGAQCRFAIRFWNLAKDELQRLIWCVALEPGLAHKIGKSRYLGFGSIRLQVLQDSYLIDWEKRYGKNATGGQESLDAKTWLEPKVIKHLDELRELLNADKI